MSYAGFWVRLGAYIIDDFLVCIISVPVWVWASFSTPWLRAGGYLVVAPLILVGVAFAFSFLYFTSFWGWRGQTPGKMAIGVRIVQTNGDALSFGRAALRYLGYLICHLTLYIGFIIVAFHEQKKGLHDIIADTCVIKVRRGVAN